MSELLFVMSQCHSSIHVDTPVGGRKPSRREQIIADAYRARMLPGSEYE